MNSVLQDLRFAARSFLRARGFTSLSLITLALAIGSTTAIFTVLRGVVLAPLPYPDPSALVLLGARWPGYDARPTLRTVSLPVYRDWRDRQRSLTNLAGYREVTVTVQRGDEAVVASALRASSNLLSVLGLKPKIGRDFAAADAVENATPVALVSHEVWRDVYQSSPAILGQSLRVNGQLVTIIGVLPPGLNFPTATADYWIALVPTQSELDRGEGFVRMIGRVAPRISLPQARRDFEGIVRNLAKEYPDNDAGYEPLLVSLEENIVGPARSALWLLAAAVGTVLLIACANLGNLFLARATARRQEMAIRVSLGGTRSRLLRQLLTEGLILALAGGIAGVLLAYWGTPVLVRLAGDRLPRADSIHMDGLVLCFAFLIAAGSSFAFGLLPALHATREVSAESLKGARGGTAGKGTTSLRRRLIAVQVALAFALLVSAGLLLRSFLKLTAVSPGFEPNRVWALAFNLPASKYENAQASARFIQTLLDRAKEIGGIDSIASVHRLPIIGFATTTFTIEGRPTAPDAQPVADFRLTSPNYFKTLGIPFRAGRDFDARDTADRPDVIVVSETFARRFWPGENALGKRLSIDTAAEPPREVVGVVGDIKTASLESDSAPTIYAPYSQNKFAVGTRTPIHIVVRSTRAPGQVLPELRSTLHSIDPALAFGGIQSFEEILTRSTGQRRLQATLLGLFAASAGLLAVIGVYAVTAYSVIQRVREIGVRMALGAGRPQILGLLLRQNLRPVAIGIILGLSLALLIARLLAGHLFGISAVDPLTYLAVGIVFAATALLACWVPALRATKIEPVTALRSE